MDVQEVVERELAGVAPPVAEGVGLSADVEEFISTIKLMRLQLPRSPRYRYCEEFLQHEFPKSTETMSEAMRLMHLADSGDAASRALVDPIAPAWEFGAWLNEDDTCPQCSGRSAKARRTSAGVKESGEPASAPYVPSTKPGSTTDALWQALLQLSPEGEPVDPKEWRDASLIVLARSTKVVDPIAAFRDAKRNLKSQGAFTEVSDVIRRRT